MRACRMVIADPYTGIDHFISRVEEKLYSRCIDLATLIREELKEGSDLGIRTKAFMDRGEVLSDELIKELVSSGITKDDSNIVIKNFPRTATHLEILQQCLKESNIEVAHIWYLRLSNPDVIAENEFKKFPENNEKYEITLQAKKEKLQLDISRKREMCRILQNQYPVTEIDTQSEQSLIQYYDTLIDENAKRA